MGSKEGRISRQQIYLDIWSRVKGRHELHTHMFYLHETFQIYRPSYMKSLVSTLNKCVKQSIAYSGARGGERKGEDTS